MKDFESCSPIGGNMEQITLDKVKFGITQSLTAEKLIFSTDVDVTISNFSDSIVASLTAMILGKKEKVVRSVYMPDSWWQHFKREVMPEWFTDLWPVKETIIPVQIQRFCPHEPLGRLPKEHKDVHIAWMTNDEKWLPEVTKFPKTPIKGDSQ
jgi:hypothetical protein